MGYIVRAHGCSWELTFIEFTNHQNADRNVHFAGICEVASQHNGCIVRVAFGQPLIESDGRDVKQGTYAIRNVRYQNHLFLSKAGLESSTLCAQTPHQPTGQSISVLLEYVVSAYLGRVHYNR